MNKPQRQQQRLLRIQLNRENRYRNRKRGYTGHQVKKDAGIIKQSL